MNDVEVSKMMSYALRHGAKTLNLEIDTYGFIDINVLINTLNKNKKINNVTRLDIERIVKEDNKQRYEIVDDKIRAFYGHNKNQQIDKLPSEPPEILYHGTTQENLKSIFNEGLKPMQRQYVHYSIDIETATIVGKRYTHEPVILIIKAKEAFNDGIKFFKEPNGVYQSESLPSKYIFCKDIK